MNEKTSDCNNKEDTPNKDRIADAYKELKNTDGFGTGHHSHHEMPMESLREFNHNNHHVTIKTTYDIQIDGKHLGGHLFVDKSGALSCHTFPAYSFFSAVDLVKKIIDSYPQAFDTKKEENHHDSS